MNKQEARDILNRELLKYQSKEYEALVDLIDTSLHYEREGAGGAVYQIEIQALWDNPRESEGNIRVIASIDDGRFPYSFIPLSSDFIKNPKGNLVDK